MPVSRNPVLPQFNQLEVVTLSNSQSENDRKLSRRDFITRAAVFGASVPIVGAVLAACGSSGSNNSNGSTGGSAGSTATGSSSTTGGSSATSSGGSTGASSPSGASGSTGTTGGSSVSSGSSSSALPSYLKGTPCKHKGGTAVIGYVQEPDILDPFITGETFSTWVLHVIDTPMIRAAKGGKLQAMLVTEVPSMQNGGISSDGLTYKINFRKNLKWSDGQPVTAKDLVFTWKTVMNPDYGAGSQLGWDHIKSIDLSNNNLTATIKLTEVYAPFLAYVLAGTAANTSTGFLLPEHFFKGMKPADYAKSDYGSQGSNKHVGTGAFKLTSWDKGNQITVERNKYWVGKPPCLDKIVYSILDSSDQQTSQLQTGDIDLGTNYTEADIPTLEGLKSQNVSVLAYQSVGGGIERFMFNLRDPKDPQIKIDPMKAKPHPLFSDKNVRMAITLGTNRPAYASKVLHGAAKVGVTELDGTQWFNDSLKPYPYDPDKAKQLLDKAGWKPGSDGIREKNGTRLSFEESTTSGNPVREVIQRAMINDLQQIGVEMKIRNYDPNKLFSSFSSGGIAAVHDFDMVSYTTSIHPLDPDLTPFYATNQIPSKKNKGQGGNNECYSNSQVDKLLAAQVKELNEAKRTQQLQQIQKLVYDDIPLFYAYDRKDISGVGPKLKGFQPDRIAGLWWDIEDWYLEG